MTTFSQQQGIPVSLAQGIYTAGGTAIDLDTSYDHLLTCISLFANAAALDVTLETDVGGYFFGASLSLYQSLVISSCGIVLQGAGTLTVGISTSECVVSISAYRLAPSAAEIFA